MTRGTWQGSGTWQTSGPDLRAVVLVAAVLLLGGSGVAAKVASGLFAFVIIAAVVVVLALAVTVFAIWRVSGGRGMVYRPNPPAVTATGKPQVTQGTPPAIENHYHVHHHYADSREPARVFTAIPGHAEDAITEGES